MDISLSFDGSCEPSRFKINRIEADLNDFGTKGDRLANRAPEYCCADMQFDCKSPTQAVLDRYKISTDDYWYISHKLRDGLSIGFCKQCV